MAKNLKLAKGSMPDVEAEGGRFDQISIVLHWLTVLLIIAQFTSAWLREALDHDTGLAAAILAAHRTFGVVIWIVALVRLAWRHSFARVPPFPASMPKLQQTVAKVNEYGLYALILAQPVTGLGRVLLRGAPFELFIWKVPALLAPNEAIRHLFVEAHEFGATALLAFVGVHIGAALFHRLVLRDEVLQRMSPWTSQPTRRTNAQLVANDTK